jgi:hypothetical protein
MFPSTYIRITRQKLHHYLRNIVCYFEKGYDCKGRHLTGATLKSDLVANMVSSLTLAYAYAPFSVTP